MAVDGDSSSLNPGPTTSDCPVNCWLASPCLRNARPATPLPSPPTPLAPAEPARHRRGVPAAHKSADGAAAVAAAPPPRALSNRICASPGPACAEARRHTSAIVCAQGRQVCRGGNTHEHESRLERRQPSRHGMEHMCGYRHRQAETATVDRDHRLLVFGLLPTQHTRQPQWGSHPALPVCWRGHGCIHQVVKQMTWSDGGGFLRRASKRSEFRQAVFLSIRLES